jgi:hypothetical protein
MMRIHYAGGSELTGTAIADALLVLAEQLARAGSATTIDIPVRQDDGSIGRSRLLIGPASQIMAETEKNGSVEIRDEELVLDLERQANELRPHRVGATDPNDVADWVLETDVPPTTL